VPLSGLVVVFVSEVTLASIRAEPAAATAAGHARSRMNVAQDAL
jgi:hypothetical protein